MYDKYDAIDNHLLKCNKCGAFMQHKGKSGNNESQCDNYECKKCGITAEVVNEDSGHHVFWSNDNE